MSDQLIHVRDRDGNETYVGEAWLERWPEDFTRVEGQSRPAPSPVPQPEADQRPTSNTTSF